MVNNILYQESVRKETENRIAEKNQRDYELVDELRKELRDQLGVESSCLTDLTYHKIPDDRCIPVLVKYIPLFQNTGIALSLVQQQFWRKHNQECSSFLETWYLELRKTGALTNVAENTLDNAFVKIGDKNKIPFYLELIKETDRFLLVMVMLAKWKVKEAKPVIINRLKRDKIKTAAIRALGYYEDKTMLPLLEKYLASEYPGVRQEAEKVIKKLLTLSVEVKSEISEDD